MKKTIVAAAAIGVSSAMLAAACGDDTGGGSGGRGGSGAEGPTYGTGGCDACVETECSTDLATCRSDAGCAAWLNCLDACPLGANGDADAACEAACQVDGTIAAAGRDAVVACRRTGPGAGCAECGVAPASSAGTGGPALCTMPDVVEQTCQVSGSTDSCIKCIQEECCDSYRDVYSGGPTGDLVDCWLACGDDDGDCANACYAAHPDGVAGFGSYRACTEVNCEATALCPSEHDTPCLTCQRTECTCEVARCHAEVECHYIYECFANCPEADTACGSDCVAAHPDGEASFELLSICSAQRCVTDCPL